MASTLLAPGAAVAHGAGADDAAALTAAGRQWRRLEWRASTCSAGLQHDAALAVDPESGEIVVAWTGRRQLGGRSGVLLQRFDGDGVATGVETCPVLWPRSHQAAPAVALDGSGGGWVLWQSHGQDGDGEAIIARRLGSRGQPAGDELPVNDDPRGDQTGPVVACAADGGALAAWTSVAGPGEPPLVMGRLLGPDGAPRGAPFVIAGPGPGGARAPSVAAMPGSRPGAFAAAWADLDAGARSRAVSVATIDGTGRIGAPVVVTRPGARDPIDPVVAAGDGGLVVAWIERSPVAGSWRATACTVPLQGAAPGEPVAVADPRPGAEHVAVAVAAARGSIAAGGGLVAAAFTERSASGTGIRIRFFDAALAPIGPAVPATGRVEGEQAIRAASGAARLAWAADGSLLCAWSGEGGFGDPTSVNVTMFRPASAPGPAGAGKVDRGVRAGMPVATQEAAAADAPQPHEPPVFDPRDRRSAVRERLVAGAPGAGAAAGAGDVGFTGITNTGWVPPDPHIAVGPGHVVAVANGAVAFLDRDGNLLFQDQIEGAGGFFSEVGASGLVFDPETVYDAQSGRYFIMAADGGVAGTSSFVLAVSDDGNPLGDWHRYMIDTTPEAGDLFDSPNLSVDGDAVYVTGDGFPGGPGTYPAYVLEKAPLLAGMPAVVVNRLLVPTTAQSAGIPPVNFDDPPALYMVEHEDGTNRTQIRLMALVDALGTPSLAAATIDVPLYGAPEDPPQAGTPVRPNTFDARFWSVAYRAGSLWATHHVDPARVRVRWYQIATNGWPASGRLPALAQWGEIDPGPGIRTFFSAMTADARGNASLVFARSAPDEFISMATAFRYASDPPGTFQPMVIRRLNNGPYTAAPRWGDYGAAQIDPLDGLTVWATHEYATSNSWQTWVTAFTPAFAPADLDLDGAVGASDLLLLLASWGRCEDPRSCAGDLDGDGAVGVGDLLALLAAWG